MGTHSLLRQTVRVGLLMLVSAAALAGAPGRADPLAEAERLYTEVETHFGTGDYAQALVVMQRVYDLRRTALGAEHGEVVSNLVDLALLNDLLGEFARSETLFQEALAIYARTLPEDDPARLKARSDYAQMLANAGRFSEALAINEQVLPLRLKVLGVEHQETLLSRNNLADNLTSLGRYEEAIAIHRESLPISARVLGEDDFNTNITRSNIAFNLERLGRVQEALPYREEAWERMTRTLGEDHPHALRSLSMLAQTYGLLGRHDESLRLARQAYALCQKTFGPRHPDTLLAANDLSVALGETGAEAEALALREATLPAALEVWGKDHVHTLTLRNNLARSYGALGRHADELSMRETALADRRAVLGAEHPNVLDDAREWALSLDRSGRRAEAIAALETTLAAQTRVTGAGHPETLETVYALGDLLARAGRAAEALPLLERMVAGVEALRAAGDLAADDRQALFARWVPRYERFVAVLVADGAATRAFEVAELSRARTLLEGTALRQAGDAGVLGEAERTQVRGFETRLAQLDLRLAAVTEVAQRVAVQAERNTVVREYAALRRDLATRHPKYARLQEVEVLGPAGARGVLARKSLFLSFVVAGDEVLALSVDARGRATAQSLGRAPWLQDTVEAYRRLLASPDGASGLLREGLRVWRLADGGFRLAARAPDAAAVRITTPDEIGRALGALLLEPLARSLQRHRRLIISPDGPLAVLPFETLPFGADTLLASHTVSYAQSLSVLALTAQRAARPAKALLGVGGADYAAAATALARGAADGHELDAAYRLLRLEWAPLPGSAAEVEEVTALFPAGSADRLLGAAATERGLRDLDAQGRLADYRYLLFSAHGFLSTDTPALSAVVLGRSGAGQTEDGYLTASEWPALDLKSELVVLSACETGLGRVVQGEGVTGLPFALTVAGNQRTVLSLWAVVDESTRHFMRRFFAELHAGRAPVEALTRVKREFRASAEHAAPLYWAPFVLYGN